MLDKYAPAKLIANDYSVSYQYETAEMRRKHEGVGDDYKEFTNKRDAWTFVQAVKAHAQKSGTMIDLVVAQGAVNYIGEPCGKELYRVLYHPSDGIFIEYKSI